MQGDALVAALEEAVEARVIREAGQVGHYAFTHALVRATLYDGISQLRRARLHGRVGEALAGLRALLGRRSSRSSRTTSRWRRPSTGRSGPSSSRWPPRGARTG